MRLVLESSNSTVDVFFFSIINPLINFSVQSFFNFPDPLLVVSNFIGYFSRLASKCPDLLAVFKHLSVCDLVVTLDLLNLR